VRHEGRRLASNERGRIQSRTSRPQIRGARVWDVSGVCPGFAIKAVLRRGQIDRVGTLARAVAARQEEVVERAKLGAGAPPD
jgi:hypothetical protein